MNIVGPPHCAVIIAETHAYHLLRCAVIIAETHAYHLLRTHNTQTINAPHLE